MKLEQQMYEIPRIRKERIYSIGDLENLSATALHYGEGGGSSGFSGGGFGSIGKKECDEFGIVKTPLMKNSENLSNQFSFLDNFSVPNLPKISVSKNTAYFPLLNDVNQTIGVTHHNKGLGKLKILDSGIEYGTPIIDILNKSIKDWRIDIK